MATNENLNPRERENTQAVAPQVEPLAQSPLAEIEHAAGLVSNALEKVAQEAFKAKHPRVSVRTLLERALTELRHSPHLQRISEHPIQHYWRHEQVCGQVFSGWTVRDVVSHTAREIVSMKGAGRVRLLGLVDALAFAASGALQPAPAVQQQEDRDSSCAWADKLPAHIKEEVRYLFEQGAGSSGCDQPLARLLRQIPRVLGFEPLVLVWMSVDVFHRRLAEQVGVTESRVSQILADKTERLRTLVAAEMPDMAAQWNTALLQPAVQESDLLAPWFGMISEAGRKHELGKFFLSVMGAVHPVLHSGICEDCWCMDPEALREFSRKVIEQLPMTDEQLKQYLRPLASGMSLDTLKRAMGRNVTHVKDPGVWFSDRREAVDFVLRRAGQPMTRNEIARALGVKPTQTKGLLLEHDGLERHGSNLKRTYALKTEQQEAAIKAV